MSTYLSLKYQLTSWIDIEDTIFTSPSIDETVIVRGHLSQAKGQAILGQIKAVPTFLSYFKT